ncbi:hypothetical protein Taro_028065, partial [Colocasia esculenta]|nr:hypothetical protein [Colocasia esculenta]
MRAKVLLFAASPCSQLAVRAPFRPRSFISSGGLPPPLPFGHPKAPATPAEAHLLSLLGRCASFGHICQTHAFMVPRGLDGDNRLLSKFIDGCSVLGFRDYAYSVFARKAEPDVFLCNTIVRALSQTDMAGEAIVVYRRIQAMGLRPDTYSFPFVLKAVAHLSALVVGREVHGQIVRVGFPYDVHLEEKVEPDEIALLAALSACAHLGALELGEWIHGYIDKRGLCKIVPLMNALVDMYAKCGNIAKALLVFESMKHRTVISWTTAIAGLAMHGLGLEALEMFRRMERANQKPNDVTFVAVLSACSHVGQVELGKYYFDTMSSRYRFKPRIEHYGCMVDLLGRAGLLREARSLVEDMPFDTSGAIWGSLLAAARRHGDAELGEVALRHLVELEPQNSGNYSLLSDIYASLRRWDGVGEMRKMMKDWGVKKMSGASSVEVNGTVHEFTAGDTSHPSLEEIYGALQDINGHLKDDLFAVR